jgi:hypothetical protein
MSDRKLGSLNCKLAREGCRLASNATPSYSLHSVVTKTLTQKAVADNINKPSLGDRAENPLNWNVERMRSMGEPKNEP